jgi:mono/diheme cytochrome c family protein
MWTWLVAPVIAILLVLSSRCGVSYAVEPPQVASQIYSTQCARCHGTLGLANDPDARALHHRPHSFADCDWMSLMSDATLYLIISQGGAAIGLSSEMPAFNGKLTYDQIAALWRGFARVVYIPMHGNLGLIVVGLM